MSTVIGSLTDSIRIVLAGADSVNNIRPIKGTALISDYASAYVAKGSTPGEFFIVPKVLPATEGATVDVSVTFTCTSMNGTLIDPPFVLTFTLAGPPVQSQAVRVQVLDGPNVGPNAVPTDPGSATVTF